jgi:hypothetical protein
VIARAAGTVSVAVAVFDELATEVAVTVTVNAELEAAGAVNVAPEVVVLESVPPPLTVQLTPLLVVSPVTVADSVVVSVGSTVAAAADTATVTPPEFPPPPLPPLPEFPPPPPQPERLKTPAIARA